MPADPLHQQAEALATDIDLSLALLIPEDVTTGDVLGMIQPLILAALQRVQAETREEAIDAVRAIWESGQASSLPKLIAGMRERIARDE